jgi:hypothetical protein
MRNLGKAALGGFLILGLTWSAAADQDKEGRAIIDKALKAHGGADNLGKYPAANIKAKGSMEAMGMTIKFTIEIHAQNPDKIRTAVDVDLGGKTLTVINVFDGTRAWESLMGQTKEVKDAKKLEKHKMDMYVQGIVHLAPLAGKGFEISPLGEAKVKDQDTVGVRVSAKGKPDVSLYFDKKTGLLVKSEHRTTEPFNMNEVNQESYYSDYKKTEGIQEALKIVVHHDGKLFMEMEVSETRRLEKIDKAMFAQP